MPKVRLTQDFISHHLQCPLEKSRIEYVDASLQNFFVEVRATSPSQGTFYVRYRDNGGTGTTRYARIGKTTEISLADARKRAYEIKAEIRANGADPSAAAKARRTAITFGEFVEQHLIPFIKPRKRSWERDAELYNLRIKKVFGDKRLNQINRLEVQQFHTSLIDEKLAPATADHHLKFMKRAMTLACDWQMLEINPLTRLKTFDVPNAREHYLSDEELGRLVGVLTAEKAQVVPKLALLLLATGMRVSEATSAMWKFVNRQNCTLIIPAGQSKNKRQGTVILNPAAMAILDSLGTDGRYEYLFVNEKTGTRMKSVNKRWDYLRKKAGLPHLRMHDLRHSYASFLVNSGRSLYEVQVLLRQRSAAMAQRYSHLSAQTMQDAAHSASVKITDALKNAAV